MTTFSLTINQKHYTVKADPQMPLLWVIRDVIGLTGTKFGCGIAQCGACMIHVNGKAVPSCITPVESAVGQSIITIEGLVSPVGRRLQAAWLEEDVPQCGYCQSGQLMAAAHLLAQNSKPTDVDINNAMANNLCRCGTYQRIRKAIHRAASMTQKNSK